MNPTTCCEGECIIYKGCKDSLGYGRFTMKGVQFKAHRLAYALLTGKRIPNGKVIDHMCKNTSCINPDHLRVVTNVENVMCGDSFAVKNKSKTHCINGHPFTSTCNRGWRKCRICKNKQALASYHRNYKKKAI